MHLSSMLMYFADVTDVGKLLSPLVPSTKNSGVTPKALKPAYTCTFLDFLTVGIVGVSPDLHHTAACLPLG